jgi:hypothetical protein
VLERVASGASECVFVSEDAGSSALAEQLSQLPRSSTQIASHQASAASVPRVLRGLSDAD